MNMVSGVIMKKNIIHIAILILAVALCFAACDKVEFSNEIVSITVYDISDVYFVGDEFLYSNIQFDYSYGDGRSGTAFADESMIADVVTDSPGEHTATLTYGGYSVEFTYYVGGTITYEASIGGYIDGRKSQLIPYGGSGAAVDAVPYEGYTFTAWSDGETSSRRKDTNVTEWGTLTASFSVTECVLNFFNESNESLGTQTVLYGEEFSPIVPPEGMLVDGYYNKSNDVKLQGIVAAGSMDIEVKFRPMEFTVTYTGGVEESRIFAFGDTLSFPNATPPENQRLLNWQDSEGKIYNTDHIVTEALELHAVFVSGLYNVTFISEDQTLFVLDIFHGYPLGLINEPIKEDKTFVHWVNDNETIFNQDSLIYEDTVLYAVWVDKYYTVNIALEEGDFFTESFDLLAGETIEEFSTEPLRYGYTFEGWYSDSDKNNAFVFGEPISDNTTIYIKWQPLEVLVRYVYMYLGIEETEIKHFGELLCLPQLSREAFDFGGWYKEQTFLNEYVDLAAIDTLSLTLYAKWENKTFDVEVLPLTGGSIEVLSSLPLQYGALLRYRVIPDPGYNAVLVNANSYSTVIQQTGSFDRALANVTFDVTLSAVFERYSVNINIDVGEGGTATPSGATSVLYGDDLSVIINPNTGYAIGTVKVNQITQSLSGNTLVIENITREQNVIVQFTLRSYAVSVSAPNASTNLTNNYAYVLYGGSITVTITADQNFYIESITQNNIFSGTQLEHAVTNNQSMTLTINNVTENIQLSVLLEGSVGVINAICGTGGSITNEGENHVNFGDELVFEITPDTGYFVESVVFNGENLGSIMEFTYTPQSLPGDELIATFALIPYYISASVLGGGSISNTGTSMVRYGENLAYTITAYANYHIEYLLIDGAYYECSGSNAEYTFNNIQNNHTIRAVFAINTYTVDFNLTGNGRFTLGTGATAVNITVNETKTVEHGTLLYIFASFGNSLTELTVNGESINIGEIVGGEFGQIGEDMQVSAVFSVNTYNVNTTVSGNGTVNAPTTVTHGSGFSVTYNPEQGYQFSRMTVNGTEVTPSNNSFQVVNVTGAVNINVEFVIIVLTISVSSNSGGTINSVESIDYGESAVITITSDEHYHIASIDVSEGDYQAAVGQGSYEIQLTDLTSDFVCNVIFALDTYEIAFNIGAGGSVHLSSGANYSGTFTLDVEYGATVSYEIIMDEGMEIDSLTVDGSIMTVSTSIEFESVEESHTVNINFKEKTYTITAMVLGMGNGTVSLSANTVNYGGSVTITLNPSVGYKLDTLKINGVAVNVSNNTYLLNNVTANITVSASFVLQ